MTVVGCRQGASYNFLIAEQAACGALCQHYVALLVEAVGAVALKEGEVEHREERRVGLQDVNIDKVAIILQFQTSCREAARLFYFRILGTQVSQHCVVTVCSFPCALVHVEAYVVNALCLAVLVVDAELLPRVQSDYDDERKADGQSEHVYRRVRLVPREKREIAFKVEFAHILCFCFVTFYMRLAALSSAVCRVCSVVL